MKKIIEIIINLLTGGFFVWRKYKKSEHKLKGVYKSVNAILNDPEATNTEIALELLQETQESYGVLKEVADDITELYREQFLERVK